MSVGVGVEQACDAPVELLDLGVEGREDRYEGKGDGGTGVALVADQAGWCFGEVPVEVACGASTGVAVGSEPAGESFL